MPHSELKLVSLSVRLSKSERIKLEVEANKLGCSKSEYVRMIVNDREIKQSVIPQVNRHIHQELAQMKTELVRQGVNLNQIARALNAAAISPELILQLMELIGANHQSQADIGICKSYILMGKTDDWEN